MRILNSLIVPKYLKGETLWAFWHFSLLQNIKKTSRWKPFEGKKMEKSHSAEKKLKRGPFSLVRFRKCSKRFLAKARTRTCDRWVHRELSKVCTKKWCIHDEVCGLTKNKEKN